MKKNRSAQLRHPLPSTRGISVAAFSNLRSLLVCAAASLFLAGTLLAFFQYEAPSKVTHPAVAGLTFAERIAYQRAIEEVYCRHRIWPRIGGENSRPKPSLDHVMSDR